jgi:hypothetical protein
MNHVQILKRAWKILWNYRALWVLGFLLALTTGGGGSSGSGGGNGGNGNNNFPGPGDGFNQLPQGIQELIRNFTAWAENFFRPENAPTLIGIGIALAIVFIALGVISSIVHYVSTTSIIRMVDTYERTEEKVSWRQGWRMGWSREAWRLFLIDLVIFLPVFVVVIVLFGCAALPLILGSVAAQDFSLPGLVGTIGIGLIVLFIIFAIALILAFFMELARREAVLKGSGVFESIRAGWSLARAHLKDVFILWLIMVGVRIGTSIVMIPIVLIVLLIGALIGGGAGAGLYFLLNAVATGAAAWGWGIAIGAILFLLVLILPLTLLSGLYLVYHSSVWTLAYRELINPVREIISTPAPGGSVLPAA